MDMTAHLFLAQALTKEQVFRKFGTVFIHLTQNRCAGHDVIFRETYVGEKHIVSECLGGMFFGDGVLRLSVCPTRNREWNRAAIFAKMSESFKLRTHRYNAAKGTRIVWYFLPGYSFLPGLVYGRLRIFVHPELPGNVLFFSLWRPLSKNAQSQWFIVLLSYVIVFFVSVSGRR